MVTANVIIAGAPKCGTTSLFEWLAEHPEVCASREKELCFFLDKSNLRLRKKGNYHQHGIEEYHTCFTHCERSNAKVILEASPVYLYSRTALEALPLLKPRPKILFILRKPSDRVYSSFQFHFNNLVALDKDVSFKEFVRMVEENPDGLSKYDIPQLSLRNIIEWSKYVNYIPDWMKKFGKERVHVFLFENLKENPAEFMREVSKAIGIDSAFWDSYSFPIKNTTYYVKNKSLHKVMRRNVQGRLSTLLPNAVMSFLRKTYYVANAKKIPGKTDEDRQTLSELDEKFEKYNKALSEQLNLDLSAWEVE